MASSTPALPPLLTLAAVAQHLGKDPKTIRSWCRDGKLPAVMLPSGRRLIRLDTLSAMLEPAAVAAQ